MELARKYGENHIVIILGGLHIEMAVLKVIDNWLEDCAGEDPGGLRWLHLQPPFSSFFFFFFVLELHAHATKTHHPLEADCVVF